MICFISIRSVVTLIAISQKQEGFVLVSGTNVRGANVIAVRIGIGCVDKNFNIGHNFQTRRGRALMCIPCDQTFQMVP